MAGIGLSRSAGAGLATSRERRYRAAVIGRTGGGDYGHGYDRVFNDLENVVVEAVADPDPVGLRQAAARCGARRTYLDYRAMLERERPDLVSVAPRQPDCHQAMALAALAVGAHLFVEKPFTEVLAEADEVLAAAEQRGSKIVVAHNRRYTADFVKVKALLDEGFVGTIREVRIQGKQDQRAGGEDLLVLGTHDFDLLRFYFGDPIWCQASVTVGGRDITRGDVRRGQEPVWVAGDHIHASFAFGRNLLAHWSSLKTGDDWNRTSGPREKWAFEIYGTRRILAYQAGFGFAYLDSPFLAHRDDLARWRELPEPKALDWPGHARQFIPDLVHAIENSIPPVCSGVDGRWAVEMVAAVYQSQQRQGRVRFPLADRAHPLERF
jgi:predicted dehydrogenase